MSRMVTVTIDKKGNAKVLTEGYNGVGCSRVHEGFAKRFGTVTSSQETAEMYNTDVQTSFETEKTW